MIFKVLLLCCCCVVVVHDVEVVLFELNLAGEGGLVPGARGVSVFQVNDVYLLS